MTRPSKRELTACAILESVLQAGVDEARALESREPLSDWESGYRMGLYSLLHSAYVQAQIYEEVQGESLLNGYLRSFNPDHLLELDSVLSEGDTLRPDDRLAFALMARMLRDPEAAVEVLRVAAGCLRRGERMPDEIADHVATAFELAAMEPAPKRARVLARYLHIEDLGTGAK